MPAAVILAVSLVLLSLFEVFSRQEAPKINDIGADADLCRQDNFIPAHTIILIDTTDRLPEDYNKQLVQFVEKTREEIGVHEKITILHLKHAPPDDADTKLILHEKLSICSPGTPEEMKDTSVARRKARNLYHGRFEVHLREFIEILTSLPEAPNTPLLAALKQITQRPDFGLEIPNRRLAIFSDFLQYTNEISHYCRNSWCIESPATLQSKGEEFADFTGIHVVLSYIYREPEEGAIAHESQTKKHRRFWQDYFKLTNAASTAWFNKQDEID